MMSLQLFIRVGDLLIEKDINLHVLGGTCGWECSQVTMVATYNIQNMTLWYFCQISEEKTCIH